MTPDDDERISNLWDAGSAAKCLGCLSGGEIVFLIDTGVLPEMRDPNACGRINFIASEVVRVREELRDMLDERRVLRVKMAEEHYGLNRPGGHRVVMAGLEVDRGRVRQGRLRDHLRLRQIPLPDPVAWATPTRVWTTRLELEKRMERQFRRKPKTATQEELLKRVAELEAELAKERGR